MTSSISSQTLPPKASSERPLILMAGCGNMGGAMLKGWLKAGLPYDFAVLKRTHTEKLPPEVAVFLKPEDLKTLPKAPDMIVLAVKPAQTKTILKTLSETLGAETLAKSCLLSVMAGIKTEMLSDLSHGAPAMVAMPNIAAQLQVSASSLFVPEAVPADKKQLAIALVEAFGSAVLLQKEEQIPPAIGLAGSGSAYVFLLAELLEKTGVENGLPPQEASQLARDMIYGAGVLLKNSSESAENLRKQVTSPNGTTAAALNVLMAKDNWPKNVEEAVKAAILRAHELSTGG